MKKILFFCCLVFMLPVSLWATDLPSSHAVLRLMDKVTGRVTKLNVQVGENLEFGKLNILVKKCFTRPPEEAPENKVFLTVFETTLKEEETQMQLIFNGWMFSSNPALSSMEHPVYDIWVLKCQGIQ